VPNSSTQWSTFKYPPSQMVAQGLCISSRIVDSSCPRKCRSQAGHATKRLYEKVENHRWCPVMRVPLNLSGVHLIGTSPRKRALFEITHEQSHI
jgi:hypothetical protein